ncbi:hypothetical protein U1Q18_040549 [Sarracenia purpurea var. burkii]
MSESGELAGEVVTGDGGIRPDSPAASSLPPLLTSVRNTSVIPKGPDAVGIKEIQEEEESVGVNRAHYVLGKMPESIPPNPARSIAVRAEAEVDKHRNKQNSSHPVAETMLATSVAAGPGPPLSWATIITTNGASRLDAGGFKTE